jgi:hypothetical protein
MYILKKIIDTNFALGGLLTMMQLKCTTSNCQHNLKCHCNAGVISVTDKAMCDSKMKRAGGALEQTFKELEASDEFLNDAPSVVQCTAECVYNENKRCKATSILVSDTIMSTKCITRIRPKN